MITEDELLRAMRENGCKKGCRVTVAPDISTVHVTHEFPRDIGAYASVELRLDDGFPYEFFLDWLRNLHRNAPFRVML